MAGTFLRVSCEECGTERVVFSKAASTITCIECGGEVATPTGGEAILHGEIVEAVEAR